MILATTAWERAYNQTLLPETFLEISCGLSDVDAQNSATVSSDSEAEFTNTSNILGHRSVTTPPRYATLEHNLWLLDGSRKTVPGDGSYANLGYASAEAPEVSVKLTMPSLTTTLIPGLTITWCEEFGEYPTSFTVTFLNGSSVVATTTIEDNTEVVSLVDIECTGYDSLVIDIHEWCLPEHRARVELVMLGHTVVFTKEDILSYTHEQHGCISSGELPKNSIEFSLNNADGRWNLGNPTGVERFLCERQRVVVRYGMDIGGTVEWVQAGTFYLSEWRTPPNTLEACFVARDIFEYLLNNDYTASQSGTLQQLASHAVFTASVPTDYTIRVDSSLSAWSAERPEKCTSAELIQLCANAGKCVVWENRAGSLQIVPMSTTHSGFTITAFNSYYHPETILSKQLKAVAVTYNGDQTYTLTVGSAGETQTIHNPLIQTEAQAAMVAAWIRDNLISRETIEGEFRADPRLDVYDIVSVETRYGVKANVVITNIKYTYTGCFRGTYSGRVINI